MDGALRGAAVGVRRLEESVQTSGHAAGAIAGGRASHAVWAHVREVGDGGDRGQFAASQGASGTPARNASGPAGEETAAQANRQSRTRQRVFGEGLFAGTQSAVCASGCEGGGLPSTRAAGGRTGPDFPFGKRAHDQQRLGGALPEPVVSTGAAKPPQRTRAGQSVDM